MENIHHNTPERRSNSDQEKIKEVRSMLEMIVDYDLKYGTLEHSHIEHMNEELRQLRDEYGEKAIHQYKLWHTAIGSTIVEAKSPYLDLPNHEIENLVRRIYDEISAKQK